MTTAPTPPTETTYSWAAWIGSISSILGLVLLAIFVTASVNNQTAAGYAPMPSGATALACCLVTGGVTLCLFRILHAKFDALLLRLEQVDQKLNSVWGIAAQTSIEAVPARAARASGERGTRHRGKRSGRRRHDVDGGDADAEGGPGASVTRLPSASERHVRALKNIAKRIVDNPEQ